MSEGINWEEITEFIINKISKTKIPALSIAVVIDDEVKYAKGFGYRDLELGISANEHTIYGIGSVTKSFTALAIMQLKEKGLLDTSDSVSRYLGIDLKVRGEEVTIHHLLTHTSGIPALGYAEALIDGYLGITNLWLPITDPEDIMAFMRGATEWSVAKPGERFYYLNEGYVLLGKIIEKVSGRKYSDYVRRNILKPLDMKRTYLKREEVIKDENVATPYIIGNDGKVRKGKFPYGIQADGGILSNVMDLSNYIMMYLNRGRFKGKEVISEKSIKAMERPYIRIPHTLLGNEGYGYGLIIYPNFLGSEATLVCHSGSVLVYTAFLGYVPEKRVGVAILANASGYPLSHMGMYVIAKLLGIDVSKLPFIKYEEITEKLIGNYVGFKGTIKARVSKEGDFLYIIEKIDGKEVKTPLIPIKLSKERAEFYTLMNSRKVLVEFIISEKEVVMLYERYKLVKKP